MENITSIELFKKLASINCSKFVERLKVGAKEYSYLSWPHAWSVFCQNVENPSYEILETVINQFGIMINTQVTAHGIAHKMWLPILDSTNKPMKELSYTYEVRDYKTNNKIEKIVEAVTMFDINTARMRCLVKNLAMFGLGINIYAGEDLPLVKEDIKKEEEKPLTQIEQDLLNELKVLIISEDELIKTKFTDTQQDWLKIVIANKNFKVMPQAIEKIKSLRDIKE
jgi:hypothetical protein